MISFDCKCGKRLRTRPEAAGKRVKCPGCGQPVQVPVISAEQAAKTALADARKQTLLDEQPTSAPAGSSYCPKCHVVLLEGAVLCTTCGYDLRTGRVIERKKTLNERIPWGAVRSVLVNLALLAIVVSIGLWAVNRMKTAQQADEQQEKEKKEKEAAAVANRVARKEREKKARFLPLVIALQVNARVDGPAPPDTFSLKCTDGAHTAGEARATLVKKVRQEVYDAFFLKGHRMGGAEAASAAGTPPVKLVLNADVEVAWTYVTVDKSIVPRAPRITQCSLSLRREGKQPMWLSPKFYDERTTPAGLDTAALARIAKLGGATTGMNFERRADREAALAARRMFAGPGAPGQAALTRFLNADRMAEKAATEAMIALDEQSDGAKARELAKRGNLYLLASLAKRLDALEDLTLLAALAEKVEDPEVARRAAHAYVAATGKLPTTKRAMKLKQPHLLLMGPLRKAFIEPRESFTDLAPFLTDMSGSTPHLALAFARTALKSETKAAARTALGRLCTKIEATRTGIKRHEERALIELAATEPGHELGRQALLALVQSGCSLAEQPAVEYMVAVGAGIVPDVEPAPPGGGLLLSDTQMAILEGIARCSENEASDAAVALLLRVSGPQREMVRKYLRFPPPTRESSIKAIETIQKGAPKEVVALTRTLAKHPALYPVAEHLVEAYYRYTREKVAPALRMALLEYLVYVAARPYAFSDTFVRLAQSTDKAERSAAIASIGRVAHTIAVYPERLKPLIAKETDPKLKAQLEAARRKAQEALLIDPRRPSPQHH